ncbi:MAG: hypothetical protein H6765_03490 [Candidatus Peribacteria bacterium]|nr:MAG: hypothetical protein H6765_03490 [Candidatus Peribacteria bacterium]
MREAEDFEGITTNFLTYGCDPAVQQPWVLVEYGFQYRSVPACLSFSVMKRYLISFVFDQLVDSTYLYDIVLPDGQVLFSQYPLYQEELGNIYMSLVYWDQELGYIKSIRASGDLLKYVISILRHDIATQSEVLRLTQTA